jgi:hypothetical protein
LLSPSLPSLLMKFVANIKMLGQSINQPLAQASLEKLVGSTPGPQLPPHTPWWQPRKPRSSYKFPLRCRLSGWHHAAPKIGIWGRYLLEPYHKTVLVWMFPIHISFPTFGQDLAV